MTTTEDLFVPSTTIDPNKDYLPELVGEDKKFKTPNDLARGKFESDLHIARLEREAELLRTDLARKTAIEEAAAILAAKTNASTTTQSNGGNTSDDGNDQRAQIKPEEINKLVQSEVSRISAERTAEANVGLVKSELTKAWGVNYAEKLEAKANELGVSKDYILEQAREHPKVLLTLVMGASTATKEAATSSLFSPSQAGVNTAALASSTSGKLPEGETWADWKKIKKDNPKYYDSVEGTVARHKAASKHGPAFYG